MQNLKPLSHLTTELQSGLQPQAATKVQTSSTLQSGSGLHRSQADTSRPLFDTGSPALNQLMHAPYHRDQGADLEGALSGYGLRGDNIQLMGGPVNLQLAILLRMGRAACQRGEHVVFMDINHTLTTTHLERAGLLEFCVLQEGTPSEDSEDSEDSEVPQGQGGKALAVTAEESQFYILRPQSSYEVDQCLNAMLQDQTGLDERFVSDLPLPGLVVINSLPQAFLNFEIQMDDASEEQRLAYGLAQGWTEAELEERDPRSSLYAHNPYGYQKEASHAANIVSKHVARARAQGTTLIWAHSPDPAPGRCTQGRGTTKAASARDLKHEHFKKDISKALYRRCDCGYKVEGELPEADSSQPFRSSSFAVDSVSWHVQRLIRVSSQRRDSDFRPVRETLPTVEPAMLSGKGYTVVPSGSVTLHTSADGEAVEGRAVEILN